MLISNIFLLLLCFKLSLANIWDNVYSKLNTKHHIIIPQTDSFQIAYNRRLSTYVLSVKYHRNRYLNIEIEMLIGSIFHQPILIAKLDAQKNSLLISITSPLNICQDIQLPQQLEIVDKKRNYSMNVNKFVNLQFLVNFITEYQRTLEQPEPSFIYKLNTSLFDTHNNTINKSQIRNLQNIQEFQEFQKKLKAIQKDQLIFEESEIDNEDIGRQHNRKTVITDSDLNAQSFINEILQKKMKIDQQNINQDIEQQIHITKNSKSLPKISFQLEDDDDIILNSPFPQNDNIIGLFSDLNSNELLNPRSIIKNEDTLKSEESIDDPDDTFVQTIMKSKIKLHFDMTKIIKIEVNRKKYMLERRQVQIIDEIDGCKKLDWTKKTLSQILDQINKLIYRI